MVGLLVFLGFHLCHCCSIYSAEILAKILPFSLSLAQFDKWILFWGSSLGFHVIQAFSLSLEWWDEIFSSFDHKSENSMVFTASFWQKIPRLLYDASCPDFFPAQFCKHHLPCFFFKCSPTWVSHCITWQPRTSCSQAEKVFEVSSPESKAFNLSSLSCNGVGGTKMLLKKENKEDARKSLLLSVTDPERTNDFFSLRGEDFATQGILANSQESTGTFANVIG